MTTTATRDSFIRHALLHHLTNCTSDLFYRCQGSVWEGDRENGMYNYHNGSGDYYTLEWNATDLVGLVFAHESNRSQWRLDEKDREPYTHLTGLPNTCRPLVERALKGHMCERLVTAGLWTDSGRIVVPESWNPQWCHGLEMFWRYGLSMRAAMLSDEGQNWLELSSLTPDHAEVLLALAERLEAGNTILTQEEKAVLLQPPLEQKRIGNLKEYLAELAAVGVMT